MDSEASINTPVDMMPVKKYDSAISHMSYRKSNGSVVTRTSPASPEEEVERGFARRAYAAYDSGKESGRERVKTATGPLKLEAMSEDEEARFRTRVQKFLDQQGTVQNFMDNARAAPAKPAVMAAERREHYTVPDYAIKNPEAYTRPFCEFLTENPTVFHAVAYFEEKLSQAGFKKVSTNSLHPSINTNTPALRTHNLEHLPLPRRQILRNAQRLFAHRLLHRAQLRSRQRRRHGGRPH
jgi:hypothetical protein